MRGHLGIADHGGGQPAVPGVVEGPRGQALLVEHTAIHGLQLAFTEQANGLLPPDGSLLAAGSRLVLGLSGLQGGLLVQLLPLRRGWAAGRARCGRCCPVRRPGR